MSVKTENPIFITDTPTTAFEKISMDIVGPLPETVTLQFSYLGNSHFGVTPSSKLGINR